jgi:hypothetical protein
MIRLKSQDDIVGMDHHRSGWPYALRSLASLNTPTGVLFDDFVDKSFGWSPITLPYDEPWIGVFHKPPLWPEWLGPPNTANTPSRLLASPLFQRSATHLRLAIAFSSYLAAWLRARLRTPVISVSHPTDLAVPRFSQDAFHRNTSKHVLQIGYTLRNVRAIYQLSVPERFKKVRIRLATPSAQRCDEQVTEYWRTRCTRVDVGHVHEIERLDNARYDHYLTCNVVFLELFDSSANNTTLECIARHTPLIVNRLPALEEYLGREYPLFYDHFDDVGDLLSDDALLAGHTYLKHLDTSHLSGDTFCNALRRAIVPSVGA